MNKFEIVSRWADKGLELPKRSTAHAAGYDLAVAEDITIPPYEKLLNEMRILHSGSITLAEMADYTKKIKTKPTLVSTGLKCQIDEGWYLKLLVRSSLPLKHWLILANGEGVIDGDYYNNPDNEGEIFLQLINLSPFSIELKKGDKIGQAIFVPYGLIEGDKYGAGEERKGGFGSTSKKLYNDFINVHGKTFSFKDNTESLATEYAIDHKTYNEITKPIEPKYITSTNVNNEFPYEYAQLTFEDWEKMKDSLV